MLQSLVITLREGVEAALIVGIVLGYLRKTRCRSWNRIVYGGLLVALLASLVAAYFVRRLEVAEEFYQGWLMLTGAVFVTSTVVWMWRTGKHAKQEIEARLSTLSSEPGRFAALGLFLFVFLMVLREGMETVLFLAAVSLRTNELLNFIGGMIGLGLAVGLGIAFFKGSLKVNLGKFFAVTSVVLLVVAAQLAVSGVHELSEAQVLPSSQREMRLVGRLVNNDTYFFVVVVALALFLIVAQRIQAGGPREAELVRLPPPERRKVLAELRRDRFWKTTASAVGLLVIVLMSAQFIYSRTGSTLPPRERVSVADGEARIPVAQLSDHNLHRYVVEMGGREVNFIALLDSTDTVRAALDACVICGAQGYRQDGRNVVCQNCAAAIYVPTIGVAGGCNPIHIDYQVDHDTVVLSETALAAGAKFFK
jgi:high-affinity iron transporter